MADPWGEPSGVPPERKWDAGLKPRVQVYLDNGVVFEYTVSNPIKGREHAHAIVTTGYRHTPQGSSDLVWYPPHRISQVKVQGGGESTQYKDIARAT